MNIQQKFQLNHFGPEILDQISAGTFFHPDSPQLPSRSGMGWRLFTSVTIIDRNTKTGGRLDAQGEVDPKHMIFTDHFPNLSVLPGLYLQDQLLQLAGFLIGVHGVRGQGFALRSGVGKFKSPVGPDAGKVSFNLVGKKFRRSETKATLIANGSWAIDRVLCGLVEDMVVHVGHP